MLFQWPLTCTFWKMQFDWFCQSNANNDNDNIGNNNNNDNNNGKLPKAIRVKVGKEVEDSYLKKCPNIACVINI